MDRIPSRSTALAVAAVALLLLTTLATPPATTIPHSIWQQLPDPQPHSGLLHPKRTQQSASTSIPSADPPATPPRAPVPSPKPHYYLALIAVFKNEAHILHEWLHHYHSQGVDHVVLVNNNSTDPFAPALRPFLASGFVTLHKDNRPHRQLLTTNKFFRLDLVQRSRWVLVLDTDEFMYAPAPGATIASVLHGLEAAPATANVSQVCVPWQFFSAANYTAQPRCVVQAFTRRLDMPSSSRGAQLPPTKCAVRSQRVKRLLLHHHVAHGATICADGSPEGGATSNGVAYCTVNRDAALLRLNHYPTQALDFFRAVKATRGDATDKALNHVRNDSYWHHYNQPGVPDTELAELQARYPNSRCRNSPSLTQPYGYQRILADLANEEARATR